MFDPEYVVVSNFSVENYKAIAIGNIFPQGIIRDDVLLRGWSVLSDEDGGKDRRIWENCRSVQLIVRMSNTVVSESWPQPLRQNGSNDVALNARSRGLSSIRHLNNCRNRFSIQWKTGRNYNTDPGSLVKMETLTSQDQATLSSVSSISSGSGGFVGGEALPEGDQSIYYDSPKPVSLKTICLVLLSVVLCALGSMLLLKAWRPPNFDLATNMHVSVDILVLTSAILIWVSGIILLSALELIFCHAVLPTSVSEFESDDAFSDSTPIISP